MGRVPGPEKGHALAGQGCDTLGKVPVPKGWRWGQQGHCLALLHPCLLGQQAQAGGWEGGSEPKHPTGPRGPPCIGRRWAGASNTHLSQNVMMGGWQQDRAALRGKPDPHRGVP